MRLEAEADDADDLDPPGQVVVLDRAGDTWVVFFDPPLPDGDHRATFSSKDSGWQAAIARAAAHRFGFHDGTNPKFGSRAGARK